MDKMLELAERCEAATGPDRELDACIAVVVYSDTAHADPRDNTHARFPSRSDECAPGTYWISAFSGLSLWTAEPFTASLDAAMTLVPEGHYWDCGVADGLSGASVWPANSDRTDSVLAATPALALVAAALRARARAKDQSHDG